LFEDIYSCSTQKGFHIRNIWTADLVHTGQSAILNADKLGNEVFWFDHSRDLLQMGNHFRSEMVQPIMGMGHSAGGAAMYVEQFSKPNSTPTTDSVPIYPRCTLDFLPL
jgi:hypothetical protein